MVMYFREAEKNRVTGVSSQEIALTARRMEAVGMLPEQISEYKFTAQRWAGSAERDTSARFGFLGAYINVSYPSKTEVTVVYPVVVIPQVSDKAVSDAGIRTSVFPTEGLVEVIRTLDERPDYRLKVDIFNPNDDIHNQQQRLTIEILRGPTPTVVAKLSALATGDLTLQSMAQDILSFPPLSLALDTVVDKLYHHPIRLPEQQPATQTP